MLYTKGEINRLGQKIKSEYGNISDKTIIELESYRASHKESLSEIFIQLCRVRYKIDKNAIITYRIKRYESIINKLNRFPKMQFSRMWDIGGCRCIVNSNNEVYKYKEIISKLFNIKKENDYIKNPQDDGYKSLHLYVNLDGDDKTLEIQIRNQNDHNWATLVEISDLLFDSGLKEYGKNSDLLKFHRLLSKRRGLTLSEKKEIFQISKKYKYIDKLTEIFVRNNLRVREQWLNIESKSKLRYFLIETTKSEVPKIIAYDNFEDAEEDYFLSFKNNQEANIVLTHLPKPNYNQISIAYSNYILTMHSFEDESSLIFEELIKESLKNNSYFLYFKYFDYYFKILVNRVENSLQEIHYSRQVSNKKPKLLQKKISKKEREWSNDINNESKKIINKLESFKTTYSQHLPHSRINFIIIKNITKFVTQKYVKRIEKARKKYSLDS